MIVKYFHTHFHSQFCWYIDSLNMVQTKLEKPHAQVCCLSYLSVASFLPQLRKTTALVPALGSELLVWLV